MPVSMNKQDIIAHITPGIYAIECEDAWKAAPFTGGYDVSRFYSSDTPFKISQLIWETDTDLDDSQKVKLLFDVYADLPCYTLLSELYIHHYRHLDAEAQGVFWHEVSAILAQPKQALAQPIVYTLAVDFFEDSELCSPVWNRLVTAQAPDHLVIRTLEASAAVPYVLKEAVYQQLLPDPRWHEAIYQSLRTSYYSVYGAIDKVHARNLVTQLILPFEGEDRSAFQQALECGER
jgi:hypothetical protein